ncbi:MAG: nucleoside-diphosphate kinase [Planctomycetota bacterium]
MNELAYALVTPYSLSKSRTGGILGRILARTGLRLAGARLYSPSDEFAEAYAATFERSSLEPRIRNAVAQYIREQLIRNNRFKISNRCLLYLFEGPDAERLVREVALGPFGPNPTGDTVRGTYGEYLWFNTGDLPYFEPAALGSTDPKTSREQLKLFADRALTDGGVLERVLPAPAGQDWQTTLVMIKPDSFRQPSVRPGNIMDMFSHTGLSIAAARIVRMNLEQAEAFYGPVRPILLEKKKGSFIEQVRTALKTCLPYEVPQDALERFYDILKERHVGHEFNQIIHYMTGLDAARVPVDRRKEHGPEQVLALLYRGENAIAKVREKLGSTDPRKAAPGTVRSDFGRDITENAAHASDSPENAMRERRIVGLVGDEATSEEADLIRRYVG